MPAADAVIEAFVAAMAAAGLAPDDPLIPSDKIARYRVRGDRKKDGWYLLHVDGAVPAGAFGSWRTGAKHTWAFGADRPELTVAEEAALRERQAAIVEAREAARTAVAQRAAKQAAALWEKSPAATDFHPYLRLKGVKAHGARLVDKAKLLLCRRDVASGEICSFQTITREGIKLYQTGARVRGSVYWLGLDGEPERVVIAEGFATGATIHEATGACVAVAFDAGNLRPVAEAVRLRWPRTVIVVAADNDRFTDGNPGLSRAESAAGACGGVVAVPQFAPDQDGSDFNDLAHLPGVDIRAMLARALEWKPGGERVIEMRPQVQEKPERSGPAEIFDLQGRRYGTADGWLALLMRNEEGGIKGNLHNCFIMLQHCPEWAGKIAFDRRAQRVMLLRDCPVATAGCWQDEFTSKTVAWMQRIYIPARVGDVALAIEAVAADAAYDPLVDWLLGLQWDGVERIGTWLQEYCASSENGSTGLMGSKFLIGAVARALRPGCRMDNMLVLESTQGYGKTTVVRVLGGPYAGETLPDFHSRDAMQIAGAKWIIEVPELSSMSRSQIDEVKAFITRTEDTYVPKYKRNPVTVRRGCVLVGTVNPAGPGYLLDTTGNRRYWPVKVGRVDLRRLERDREQLFAEAVYCFNHGDPWWIENEEQEGLMAAEQDLRVQHDDWVDIIARWIENEPIMVNDRVVWQPRSNPLEQTTGPDIAKDCLGLPFKDFNRSQQTRVGMAMKLLGFDHVRIRQGKTLTWGYLKRGED